MSNYIDDFEAATLGSGLPTGWTDQFTTSTWTVIDEGGDQIVHKASVGTSDRRVVTMDAVDADSTRANSEVLVRVRMSSITTVSLSGAALRVVGGGTSAVHQGYLCSFYGTTRLRISKYPVGGATATVATMPTDGLGFTVAANTWYWIRFRVNGNDLKAKAWSGAIGDEPSAWHLETTDSSVPLPGGAGFICGGAALTHDVSVVAVATNGDTATITADTTAPVLTSPTGTTASATTASGTVTTDEGNGTLYFLATTNSTETAGTVIAGGVTGGTQAVSSSGVKTVNVSALTAATGYYLHYVHIDAALNTSTRVSSALFTTSSADVTAPTLSAPSGTQTGATTATLSSTTNENNGVLYAVVTTSATPPTATQIRAGQNNAGTAAVFAANQTITSTGAKTFSATGLTAATTYYTYFHHRDASSNDSTVSAASSFTTAASGVKGVRISLYNGSTARASLTGLTVCWWDVTTPHTWGAPLYQTNSETTDASGVMSLSLAGVTALAIGSPGFLLVYKLDGSDSQASLVFAGQVNVADIA